MARVLVIEDNPANLELMVYLLSAFNHTPIGATDGKQGLEVARREKPDLIVCDVHMPAMDGYAVARQAKADPDLRAIPLIAVTALAMVGDRDKVMEAGFDGYLTKPIDPETFVTSIDAFLQATEAVARPIALASPAVPPAQRESREVILVVDDQEVNLHLHRSILEPMGYTVLSAYNMTEALAIARRELPDLIVSDVKMAAGSGFDFVTTVKADRQLSEIPVLLVTSTYCDEPSRQRGLALGATQYLFRPLDPEVFLSEVEACLSRHRRD